MSDVTPRDQLAQIIDRGMVPDGPDDHRSTEEAIADAIIAVGWAPCADEREKIAQECEAHAAARDEVTSERIIDPLPGDYVAKGNTGGLRLAASLIREGGRVREKPVPKGRVRVAIDVRLHATVPAGEASLPGADELVESVLAPGWVEALRPEVRGVQRDE